MGNPKAQVLADAECQFQRANVPGFKALDVFDVAEELHRRTDKVVDVYKISELDPGDFRDTLMRKAVAL